MDINLVTCFKNVAGSDNGWNFKVNLQNLVSLTKFYRMRLKI